MSAYFWGCKLLEMSTAREQISSALSRSMMGTSTSQKTQHQCLPCSVGSSWRMMLLISHVLALSRETSTLVTFLPPPAHRKTSWVSHTCLGHSLAVLQSTLRHSDHAVICMQLETACSSITQLQTGAPSHSSSHTECKPVLMLLKDCLH